MLTIDQVSAVLITRGDQPQMIEWIMETLPYRETVLWDNSGTWTRYINGEVEETGPAVDLKIYGRFEAMRLTSNEVTYSQDDDCLFRHHAELMAEYEDRVPTYVYGHYPEEGGYGDLPLPCGGALIPKSVAFAAFDRYFEHYPLDEALMYEADFVCGVLYPTFKQVHLPFEINYEIAQGSERLCNQPWQADQKLELTNRARSIRDEAMRNGETFVRSQIYAPETTLREVIGT